jgi:hypothetical protein
MRQLHYLSTTFFIAFLILQTWGLSFIYPLVGTQGILVYLILSTVLVITGFILNTGIFTLYFTFLQKLKYPHKHKVFWEMNSTLVIPANILYFGMAQHYFWFGLVPLYNLKFSLVHELFIYFASFVMILLLIASAFNLRRYFLSIPQQVV